SGGAVSVTGTVYGYYDTTYSNSKCIGPTQNSSQYFAERLADAANHAKADGYVASNYHNLVIVTPGFNCGFSGVAWVGANGVWLNGNLNRGVAEHELGHNLGNEHSGTLDCGNVAYAASGCTVTDYGDPFDVMGDAGAGHQYNAYHKQVVGWLPA